MSKDNTEMEVRFGTSFMVSDEEMERSGGKIVEYKKRESACEIGLLIMEQKDYRERRAGDATVYERELYVFTQSELHHYMMGYLDTMGWKTGRENEE